MKVNGVTSVDSYTSYNTKTEAIEKTSEVKTSEAKTEEPGVVYEESERIASPTRTYKANEKVINQLRADAEARIAQLQALVQQLISKQSGAYADAHNMWNFLREGNYEVDAETKAQAQADIAEDGYWGVNATSDRIIDFAMALTGGDKSKLGDMLEAFKKGYAQAEKTWGGELPEISKKTYDAVLEKFDKAINSEN